MTNPVCSQDGLRQVMPKKLPAGRGWGVLAPSDAEPGERVQVVTRRGKTWEAVLTEQVDYGVWATSETEPMPGHTRARLERRAEQREEWAESRDRKATEAFAEADMSEEKTGIPLGQPILVGHHSERRHRRVIERAERKGFEGLEHSRAADRHGAAATTIRRNLDRSIYDDDPDAIERLQEKLSGLETRRERIKDLNRRIRKGEPLDSLGLTDNEVLDLAEAARWHGRKTFPPYVLQNLGSQITTTRKRIARLQEQA